MAKGSGQKVNRRTLAGIFGVSLPTVDAWVRAGCPFDQRGSTGKEWVFDTADVGRWREERAAAEAGGAEVQDEAALRLRKLRAETQAAELSLLKESGLVAPLDQIERTWARILAEVQGNLRGAFVSRIVPQIIGETDERTIRRKVLAELDVSLETLADMDLSEEDDETDDEEAGE